MTAVPLEHGHDLRPALGIEIPDIAQEFQIEFFRTPRRQVFTNLPVGGDYPPEGPAQAHVPGVVEPHHRFRPRQAQVDFLTIGQYLQPTRKHAEVKRFVPPDEFKALEAMALGKGFLLVSASPLTRSSYHAGEDFARLRAARLAAQR